MNDKQQKNEFSNQSQKEEGLNWIVKVSVQLSPQAKKILIRASGIAVPLLTTVLYNLYPSLPNLISIFLPNDQTVIIAVPSRMKYILLAQTVSAKDSCLLHSIRIRYNQNQNSKQK
jgi:hypothetical protein